MQEFSSGSVLFFTNYVPHATQNEKSGTVRHCRSIVTKDDQKSKKKFQMWIDSHSFVDKSFKYSYNNYQAITYITGKRGIRMENALTHSILVVDDEKINLNIMNHTLQREYIIYAAKNGKTALELANECMPDLILLDVIMPEMDGYEVISKLKASEKTKDIPVIFITGLSDNEDIERGISLGAVDFVSKPLTATVLKEKVKRQLQGEVLNRLSAV